MTLPGGPTDKIGNRYELRWTADNLLRVLRGDASRIQLEEPGENSAEFWIERAGGREYHQVKRQQAKVAQGWTLSALETAEVLQGFGKLLKQPGSSCVFVSTQSAVLLQKLTERARQAKDPNAFFSLFVQDSESQKGIGILRRLWACPDPELHNALARIRVVTIDEETLTEKLDLSAAVALEGNREAAVDALTLCALKRVHEELDANALAAVVGRVGAFPLSTARQFREQQVAALASDYLTSTSFVPIGGTALPRKEADMIGKLHDSGVNLILMDGRAGCGKTGVLRQVVERELSLAGMVLPIRLDRVAPGVTSTSLGQSVGLDESPVVALARAKTPNQRGLIIVDQLDSVCLAAGRHPESLDAVEAVVREASLRSDMAVVLACRSYDLEGDPRLQRMRTLSGAQVLSIEGLDRKTVSEVLQRYGIDVRGISEPQFRLLSTPLHLSLLTQVLETNKDADVTLFRSGTDLLSAYWRYKPQYIRQMHNREPAWGPIFDRLCREMDKRGSLSVPDSVLDEFQSKDIEILCSEHVLSRSGKNKISFFHEAMFDYAFARSFVAQDRDAAKFFLNGDQDLLRRAQLRRVLAMLAESERPKFRQAAETLLQDSSLRFHLLRVVLDCFRELAKPEEADWQILDRWCRGDPKKTAHVNSVVFGRAPWVAVLASVGQLASWLRDDEKSEFGLRCLTSVFEAFPDLIPEHLAPLLDAGALKPEYLAYAFERCVPHDATPDTRKWFFSLVHDGVLPDRFPTGLGGATDFWGALRPGRGKDDEFALQLGIVYLKRRLEEGAIESLANESADAAKDIFERSSKDQPSAFVEAVAPFLLQVAGETQTQPLDGGPYLDDRVWRYRSAGPYFRLADVLLSSLLSALCRLPASDAVLERWIAEFIASKFTTAHFLVLAAVGRRRLVKIEEATTLLIDRARSHALGIGYSNARHHLAREALRVVTLECSDTDYSSLEEAVLNYVPRSERGRYGLASILNNRPGLRGHAQWQLLTAFPESRMSMGARRRRSELMRKFGSASMPEPSPARATWVPSPVSANSAAKMANAAWLGAITKYDSEEPAGRSRIDGGSHELAAVLQKEAAANPERFAKLGTELPLDSAPEYLSAILRGVADGDVGVEKLVALVNAVQARGDGKAVRAMTHLMEKHKDAEWPSTSLDSLSWAALSGTTPAADSDEEGGAEDRDLLQLGINTDRGAALSAMARLLEANPNRGAVFDNTLDSVAALESSSAVRTCAVFCCFPLLASDPSRAVRLFDQLVSGHDHVLATSVGEDFLGRAARWAASNSVELVARSLGSPVAGARKAGGFAACIGWFFNDSEFKELVPQAFETGEARLGAAEALGALAGLDHFSDSHLVRLVALLDDEDVAVRRAASQCLRQVENDVAKLELFTQKFFLTKAFADDSYSLIDILKRNRVAPVRLSIALGHEFLRQKSGEASDIRTHTSFEASHVAELVVGAWARSTGDDHGECLDILDQLLELQAYGTEDAISKALSS